MIPVKYYITLFVALAFSLKCESQVLFGVKVNYGLSFNRSSEIKYDDKFDFLDYKVRFIEQDISPVISAFILYKNEIMFLHGEIGYRTVRSRFSYINYLTYDDLTPQLETKTAHSIIVPILAGINIEKFRFGAGPILSYTIKENSIFESIVDFEERTTKFNPGFRIGMGLQLYRLYFDLSFEQRFNGVAESFYYRGDNKGFDQQSQFLNFGLGYLF